ncbi:MAG: hypothetical protein JWM10_4209 [Myxococcaceae bacterium]|nr:hypothetical protein [Myxococcaceae bacterium]
MPRAARASEVSRRLWCAALAVVALGCTETAAPGSALDAAADRGAPTVDVVADDAGAMTDVTDGGADASAAVAAYREMLRRIRVAACERAQQCGTAVDATTSLCVAGAWRFDVEPDPPRLAFLLAGIEAGRLTLEPSLLDGCLDAIGRRCEHGTLGDVAASACRAIVHGRVASGAACHASEECTAGLRCLVGAGDGGAGCPGVCAAPVMNAPCWSSVCGTLQCDFSGRCVSAPLLPPGDGSQCGLVTLPPVRAYVTCPAGRVCVNTIQTNYVCFPPRCNLPCGPDATCDYDLMRCLDAELLGPGADCSANRRACDPRRGLRCDPSDRCAPRVAEGGACQADECAVGLACVEHACVRQFGMVAAGGPCGRDRDCANGACVQRRCAESGCFP